MAQLHRMCKFDPCCHQAETNSPSARTSEVNLSVSAGTHFGRYTVYTDD